MVNLTYSEEFLNLIDGRKFKIVSTSLLANRKIKTIKNGNDHLIAVDDKNFLILECYYDWSRIAYANMYCEVSNEKLLEKLVENRVVKTDENIFYIFIINSPKDEVRFKLSYE